MVKRTQAWGSDRPGFKSQLYSVTLGKPVAIFNTMGLRAS